MVYAGIDDVSVDTAEARLFFLLSHYRLRFLVQLDRVLDTTHRFEEFRVTGRIESQANDRKLCLSEVSGGNNHRKSDKPGCWDESAACG